MQNHSLLVDYRYAFDLDFNKTSNKPQIGTVNAFTVLRVNFCQKNVVEDSRMTQDTVMNLASQTLWMTILLAAPMLLSALTVGLIVGMFQAATQINEMTLSFIPKLGILVIALFTFGPWMLRNIVDFTTRLITNIPSLIG